MDIMSDWERLQADGERLASGQVTDFLEATDICLAHLTHALDTAPQGTDEHLLEETRASIAALRLAQDVYNDLFPRADTTCEERLHFSDCVCAVGEGYPPRIQEMLSTIGATIVAQRYRFLWPSFLDDAEDLSPAVDEEEPEPCFDPPPDEVDQCHDPAVDEGRAARERHLQAKVHAVLTALGSLREDAPQEVARALPPRWRACLREEGAGLQAEITYLGELLRCLREPARLDEERAAREEEEEEEEAYSHLCTLRWDMDPSQEDLFGVRNFGRKSLDELRDELMRKGVSTPVSTRQLPWPIYDTPIEALALSPRAYTALQRAGVSTVGEVVDMTQEDLLNVPNFGRTCLDELRDRLVGKYYITPERAQEQFGGTYRDHAGLEDDEE